MKSWDASEILGVPAKATPSEIHAAYRQLVHAADRDDPKYRRWMKTLRNAKAILLSRAKNARDDAQAGKDRKWWERDQPLRPAPAHRQHSRLTWPGVAYIGSQFFAARGFELRSIDVNNFAIVDRQTREVAATLVRHPRHPGLFCFRRLDRSFGDCDGVGFFTIVGDSIEATSKGRGV